MLPNCTPYLQFCDRFVTENGSSSEKKLVNSSEREDETQSHPVRRSKATRGRGSGLSQVIVTPTTTTQPTPLSASELTSTASTGAPAVSRGAKISHGSSTSRAGRSTV